MASPNTVASRLEEMDRLYGSCLDLTGAFLEMDPLPLDQRLEDFIRNRAEILTRINDLERELPIRKDGDRAILDADANESPEDLERMIERLRERLNILLDADRRLQTKIKEAILQTRDDLSRLRLGQAILKAYTQVRMRPVYLDRHG